MTDANKWEHKEEWWKKGKEYLVVVRRHRAVVPDKFNLGHHRWAVYAYIYPDHPLFGNFQGPEMFQPAANSLPLHCGPSLLTWHYKDDGKATSVQIGADYSHLHDEHFAFCETPEDASEVFTDAENLFSHLEAL